MPRPSRWRSFRLGSAATARGWLAILAIASAVIAVPGPLEEARKAGTDSPGLRYTVLAAWMDVFALEGESGRLLWRTPLGEMVNDLAVAPDGSRAYAAAPSGIHVLDLATGTLSRTLPLGIVDSIELPAAGAILYTLLHPGDDPAHAPGPHRLAEIHLGSPSMEIARVTELPPEAYDILLAGDGRAIVVVHREGTKAEIVSLESFAVAREVDLGHRGAFLRTAVPLPGSTTVLMVEEGGERGATLQRLDIATGALSERPLPEGARFQGGAASPDGRTLYLNALSRLLLWDIPKGREIGWIPLGGEHRWCALAAGGERLAMTRPIARDRGEVTIVDLRSRSVIARHVLPSSVNAIAAWP